MFDCNNEAYAYKQRLKAQSWEYAKDSNYHSMRTYIDNLFMHRSRLLVVRVDLGFCANTQGQYDAEYARECFQRFLNNRRRNQIFDAEVGYLWSLECGPDKGFHYHCIFFFDGHLRQHGSFIGREIGKYWKSAITAGEGHYSCSNDNIERLAQQGSPIGIGMIERNNPVQRENLVWAATYLIKDTDESAMHRMLPDGLRGFRTFGRGVRG